MALAFSTWAKKRLSPTFFFSGTTRGSVKPSLSRKYFYTQTNSITTLSGVSLKLSDLIALINVPTLLTPSCEHACHPLPSRGHSSLTRCKTQATLLKGYPLTLWLPPHTYASRKRHTTSDTHTQSTEHPSLVWHAAGQSCAWFRGCHPPPSVC